MSADEARAAAMAYELHRLLGDLYGLPKHGPGSGVERAWDLMDDVIEYLDPEAPEEDPGTRRRRLMGAEVRHS